MAIPWQQVQELADVLEYRDAVLYVEPPGWDPKLGAASPAEVCKKADFARVRLGREGLATPASSRRHGFVIDIGDWDRGGGQPMVCRPDMLMERLARWAVCQAIGLSLGSGAARGFAHLGVLKVLEEARIPIDCLSGTSIGGIFALAYSMVGSADATIELARKWLGKKSKVVDAFNSLGASLVPGRRIRAAAEGVFGALELDELPIPVTAVATDLVTGEKVVLDEGRMAEAALATSAIPGFFPPIRWGDRFLIDGANVSRVPVDQLERYRCGVRLAVNVAPLPGSEAMSLEAIRKRYFSVFGFRNIWLRSWELQAYWGGTQEASHADILLEPDTRRFGLLDFDRMDELLELGIRTATEKLDEVAGIVALQAGPAQAAQSQSPSQG